MTERMVEPGTITVRRGEPADAAVVGAVTEQAYRDGGFLDVDGGDHYALELRDATSRLRQAIVLVAELDGEVVGSLTLALHGTPYSEIARPGEAEVRMLAVAPHARRRGVAERLMAETTAIARTEGLTGIVLCSEKPMHDAHRLYRKLGYRRLPERDWTIDGFELIALGRRLD